MTDAIRFPIPTKDRNPPFVCEPNAKAHAHRIWLSFALRNTGTPPSNKVGLRSVRRQRSRTSPSIPFEFRLEEAVRETLCPVALPHRHLTTIQSDTR